jgi:NAD(P)-dependent dehydrogenase (short-subunit alcohol dehydrogenase family)
VLTRPGMAKMKTRLGRAAEPQEVVDLILYLCSDKAAFITGSNYMIDGGRTCGGMD